MTSNFNQTVACPKCHHTDHAISEELHTFRLFYGQVRRPAFYCTHCDCTRPLPLPAWLMMNWRARGNSTGR